jgi:hypothetical protein
MNEDHERRISALEEWRQEREKQQLTLPFDSASLEILKKYFLYIIDTMNTTGPNGESFTDFLCKQENQTALITENRYFSYIVNTSTDTLTATYTVSDSKRIVEDMQLAFFTETSCPSPLVQSGLAVVNYYAINVSGNSFQVTTVQGSAGDIINLTDTGTGRQWVTYYS